MASELIAHMRARVEQCRRLAAMITDERAAETLRKMADDGEADIRRIETGESVDQPRPGEGPPAFT